MDMGLGSGCFSSHRVTALTIEVSMKIKRNAAKCLKCNDVIESVHVHDFKFCQCQAIFVDGGKSYIRRGGNPMDLEDLTEYVK